MSRCRGRFNDGRTAARHDVVVELTPDALILRDAGDREIARWPYDELRLVDAEPAGGGLRLKRGDEGIERLAVGAPEVVSRIRVLAPNLEAREARSPNVFRILLYGSLGVAACAALVWIALPFAAGWTARQIPVAWEEALGERVWQQMRRLLAAAEQDGMRQCAAPEGGAALARLVERLAREAQAPYRFRVTVIDIETANALALPGGRIVLFRGLIDSARQADEVAGVLAHEMAHIVRRHGTQALVRHMGLRALFGLVLGDVWAGPLGGMSETLLQLSYSREAEAEADRVGLALLSAARIRADGLAAFFERLAREGADLPPGLRFLATHPSHESRAELFAAARGGGPAMSADDWAALRAICKG